MATCKARGYSEEGLKKIKIEDLRVITFMSFLNKETKVLILHIDDGVSFPSADINNTSKNNYCNFCQSML